MSPPIDDSEILARYGLDSFASTSFGNNDDNIHDSVTIRGSQMEEQEGYESEGDGSRMRGEHAGSNTRRRHRRRTDSQARDYDVDYDYDEDDEDDERRSGRERDSMSVSGPNTSLSDRDPLHVYPSIAAMLESRGDQRALNDMAYRAKFSVSSKSFSPAVFMKTIHSDTPYADLAQGTRLLRESVSQGTEALKILVHNNFDSFVDARNKIDLLYEEMKSRSLNESAEYGTRAFSLALQDTTRRADEIYNPIIDRRARVEKIRSTLSVIERYKFYFNLPFSLIEYTGKGRFDIAVREYKKGRQLLETVTSGQLGGTDAMEEDPAAADGSQQATALGKIFQHVWKEVQGSVVELRNALFRHLSQPWRPYTEQENVIRYLLDIDPGDKDPVEYYLENQHTWIVEQMDIIYKNHRNKVAHTSQKPLQAECRRNHGTNSKDANPDKGNGGDSILDIEMRADELARSLNIESFSDFPAFSYGRDVGFHTWKQIYSVLRTLSQTLVRCLPDFWKVSQAYMEELYQKPAPKGESRRRRQQGLNLERVSKCHSLLEGIIERYGQYVLRLVGILGDSETIVNLESINRANIGTTMKRIPQTHALLAGHFMTAIMELVVNAANDIEAIDMAQEPAIILANLISQLKAGLVLFLCQMWNRDVRAISLHENWCLHHGTSYWPPFYVSRRDRQTGEESTAVISKCIANTELLPLFLRATQTILGQLNTIHMATLQPGKSTRTMMQGQTPRFDATFDEGQRLQSERSHDMHDMSVSHVKRTFFDNVYSFLDTLHMLAFSGTNSQNGPCSTQGVMVDGKDYNSMGASGEGGTTLSPTASQIASAGLSGSLSPTSPSASRNGNGPLQQPALLNVRNGGGMQRRYSFNLPARANSTTGNDSAASRGRASWMTGENRRHSVAADASRSIGPSSSAGVAARHNMRNFYVLVTLCNLTAFRLFIVPDLLHSKTVRNVFKLNVADVLPQLEKMLRRLDEMIFSYYIRDKSKQLNSIVHRGVLMGGFSWATTELPKDTQPYVSEALLYLVFTHAEIMDLIAEAGAGADHHMVKQQPLTKRIFQVLTANLAQDLLESVRGIDTFSVGGMLQCTLESLVIKRTLEMYMTPSATECFRLLHSYVQSAYERTQERARKAAAQQGRPGPRQPAGEMREVDGVTLVDEHWDIINKLLHDCTRRTQIQFRCFRQTE